MKTARQQVLVTVRSQRIVTASEISRTMQMTQANARHHLNMLVEQGLVAVVGLRPAQGKGRPEKLYGLSMQAAGHNLNWLAGALLDELMEREVDSPDKATPERLAKRLLSDAEQALVREFELKKVQKYHLTQRLYQAVKVLNHYHYEAHWEAHASAPHLILGHCPYAAIIDQHPELCIMDRLAIERLAGMPVEQTAKRQPDNRGLRQCIFVIDRLSPRRSESD